MMINILEYEDSDMDGINDAKDDDDDNDGILDEGKWEKNEMKILPI